jgi:hypothetical protein
MNATEATSRHKQFLKHEKDFKQGLKLFEQGCDAPQDKTSPQWYGWMAALEMARVKSSWLKQSRIQSGVE